MTVVRSTSRAGADWVAEVHLVTHNRIFGKAWRHTDDPIYFVARHCGNFFLVDKGLGHTIRFPIPADMPVQDMEWVE